MTAQQRFWNWFAQNEAALFSFDATRPSERERLFSQVASELAKVHPDLTFEFGPRASVREFIISAAGIRKAFPAVIALVEKAPKLERWQIIPFRPRRPVAGGILEIDGKRVNADEVQVSLIDDGKLAGIYLFIPDFQEEDMSLKQIGYLLLDEALGEYDVETKISPIKMLSPAADVKLERHPFPELPALFDQLTSRLEGRVDRPQ
jgi:hypothetical protein